jgi:hypothetical protein
MYKSINLGNRKVRLTNKTRVISLPKVWLDNLGISKGDLIEMVMLEDETLLLRKKVMDG